VKKGVDQTKKALRAKSWKGKKQKEREGGERLGGWEGWNKEEEGRTLSY